MLICPTAPTHPQPAPSRARTLEAGQGLGRLAQHRAASRPGLCAIAPGVVTSWTKMLGMGRDQVWMERQFWVWDLPYLWAFPTQGHIRDITDSLIEHCQDKRLDENANIQLSDEKIINVVIDLFGAGIPWLSAACLHMPVIGLGWLSQLHTCRLLVTQIQDINNSNHALRGHGVLFQEW